MSDIFDEVAEEIRRERQEAARALLNAHGYRAVNCNDMCRVTKDQEIILCTREIQISAYLLLGQPRPPTEDSMTWLKRELEGMEWRVVNGGIDITIPIVGMRWRLSSTRDIKQLVLLSEELKRMMSGAKE